MAPPSLFDGISRAVEVLGVPSVSLLALISGIRVFYGEDVAGVTYMVLTITILFGIYASAKYWNTRYTLGFVAAGISLWIGVPGIIPQLIPSPFAKLSSLANLVFIIMIAMMITDKW